MLGTRTCRSCAGTMAVAGSVGHLRCPHCACWMPTSESWNLPLMALGLVGLFAWIVWRALRGG
ncbi:MAG: hypothetical protein AB7N76_12890 [Planctomycetota bacterium]